MFSKTEGLLAIICLLIFVPAFGASEECYVGSGEDYRGTVAVTETGAVCMNWMFSSDINSNTHPGKGLGDHNYCRNPDGETRPWCYVHGHPNWGYCKLDKCPDTTSAPTTTSTQTDCYFGNGETYRGTAAIAENGKPCISWIHDSHVVNPVTHPGKGLGDHNFCRNPDGDSKPWCYQEDDWYHCAVDSCEVGCYRNRSRQCLIGSDSDCEYLGIGLVEYRPC